MKIESIYYEISNKCNLDCLYCYNSGLGKHTNTEFSQIWKKLINIMKTDLVPVVELSGGEPLLLSSLAEIITTFLGANIAVSMVTNGTIFNPIVYEKCSLVKVSIDSIVRSEYQFLRGQKYKQVLSNIQRYRDLDSKKLAISCTLTKINYRSIFRTLDFFINKGIRNIEVILLERQGKAKADWDRLSLSEKEIADFNIEMYNYQRNHLDINISYAPCSGVLARVLLGGEKVHYSCNALHAIRIDYWGNIFPCSFITGQKLSLGNICSIKSFNDLDPNKINLFEDAKMNRHFRIKKCINCEVAAICGGGCLASSNIKSYANLGKKTMHCTSNIEFFRYIQSLINP